MRKRLFAFLLAVAMAFESVPVSASEVLSEEENIVEEIQSEENLEEESVKETLAESDSEESTVKENIETEDGKTEESTKQEASDEIMTEIPSVEEEHETQSELSSTEDFSETEIEDRTSTETDAEDGTETMTEHEADAETETQGEGNTLEEYPDAIIPFEVEGNIDDGLDAIRMYRSVETAEKYDPRVEAPEEMTSVRNQNPRGTCWAFAAMAVLENSAIRQGIVDNNIDLSERHLAYFTFNSGTDALNNADDDSIVSSPSDTYLEHGGNSLLVATRLMNWQGAAYEKDYPYFNNTSEPPAISQNKAQDSGMIAHDIYFVRASLAEKEEKVSTIKKLISVYGCVDWSYKHLSTYYNAEHCAYYNPNKGVNHDVTVVGWDDNFPVENFGNSSGNYRPKENGAWIVKNSWGEDWGENGYFYISYEDASLADCTVAVAADPLEYDNNYFYGNTAFAGTPSSLHEGSISVLKQVRYVAQVFQAGSSASKEKLTAVSMMLRSSKLEYSIQIYKMKVPNDGVITNPEDGEAMLQTPVTGKTGYSGLYTIDLPDPVILSKGDYFSIVITFASEDNRYIYDDSIYMDSTDTRTGTMPNGESYSVSNKNTTHAGQSFYKEYAAYSEWKDTHKQGFNYRINALTVDNTCTVTFLDAEGNCIDAVEVEMGMDAIPPTAPKREGYTFKGWSGSYQNITEDKELTAEYEPIVYTITYHLDGGTNAQGNHGSYTVQNDTIYLGDPIRTGYSFLGWYQESDFSGEAISRIVKGSSGNLTLYARWGSDTEVLKPIIIPQSGIVEEGQTVVIKSNTGAQIYYTLDGTIPTKETGILYNGGVEITKDVTLKAISIYNGNISDATEASYEYYRMRLLLSEEKVTLKRRETKKLIIEQLPTKKEEKDIQWSTSNEKIALVSDDGTITGVSMGTALITAKTKDYAGNVVTAECQVTITEANDIAEGSYKDITWYIDSNGKLVVEGRGDFASATIRDERAPWYEYREKIKFAKINVIEMTDATSMFNDCYNLKSVDFSGFDTQYVVYMSCMFKGCISLEHLDLSGFNTTNVTTVGNMFLDCSSLKSINLSSFDTQNIVDMSDMFNGCNSLTDINLSSFDTHKVKNMMNMFAGCDKLTKLDLSSFNTENVTCMFAMFYGCSSLEELDLFNFNTVNTKQMDEMFANCSSLKSLNLSSFNMSQLQNAYNMFNDCDSLRIINTPYNLKFSISLPGSYWCMPDGAGIKELPQNLSRSVEIVLSPNIAIGSYKGINWIIDEDGKLTVEGKGDFSDSTGDYRAPWSKYREQIKSAEIKITGMTDASYMFNDCNNLTCVDFIKFDTGEMLNMSYMFGNCSSLNTLDLTGFDTKKVEDMSYMFYKCGSLIQVDLSGFNLEKISSNVSDMLYGCDKLIEIKTPYGLNRYVNLPAESDDVWYQPDEAVITELPRNLSRSIVISKNKVPIVQIDETISGTYGNIIWNIDKNGKLTVEGVGEFSDETGNYRAPWYFYGKAIKSAEIKVTGMTDASYMFHGCSNLTKVNSEAFDTSSLTKIGYMFSKCNKLESIDLSQLNGDNVTDYVRDMLEGCVELTTIKTPCHLEQYIGLPIVSGYEWQQPDGTIVSSLPQNMNESVTLIRKKIVILDSGSYKDVTWKIDTYGKLTIEGTGEFSDSSGYARAPWYQYRDTISSVVVKLSGVLDLSYMFYGCKKLCNVELYDLEIANATMINMKSMFAGCTDLAYLDLCGLDFSRKSVEAENMFEGCNNLNIICNTPPNLSSSILLPVSQGYVWHIMDDDTIINELPRNLNKSITIARKEDDKQEKVYTVTFDLQGHGSELEEYLKYTKIPKGSTIHNPEPPRATGYQFTGWYKDLQCNALWNFATDVVEADMTLYAGWKEDTIEPESTTKPETEPATKPEKESAIETVTEPEKESTIETVTESEKESTIETVTEPEKESTIETATESEKESTIETTTEPMTEVASESETELTTEAVSESETKPESVKEFYTVLFELQGHGMALDEYSKYVKIPKGSTINEPTEPKAEGYKFTGWYKEEQCSVLWNFATDIVEGNTVLYAGWESEERPVSPEKPNIPSENIPDGIWIEEIKDYTYTGKAIEPSVSVYYNKKKLVIGRDYAISYQNNIKASKATSVKPPTVIVKGKGNYSGTRKAAFTINKVQLTKEGELKAAQTYPVGVKYTPVVMVGSNALKAGTDYIITYMSANGEALKKQPVIAGNYQMRIIGKGSCEGEISFAYSVSETGGANMITKGTATVNDMIYGGSEPNVTLTIAGKTLVRNMDYMVSFDNFNKKGTATATIIGIGNYTGTLKKNFKVQAAVIQEKNIYLAETAAYEKGGAKANVSVLMGDVELVLDTDYTVSYKNNTKIGTASVTIKGKGNYTGKITKYFKVEPQSLSAEGIQIFVSDVLSGKKPAIMIYDINGKKLSAPSDYTAVINIDSHQVSITGGKNGLYNVQTPMTIIYKELDKGKQITSITLNKKAVTIPEYFVYTGKEVELEKDWLVVKAGKTVLKSDEFEIIDYVNNIQDGTATVIIQGLNAYGGIKMLNYKIMKKKL